MEKSHTLIRFGKHVLCVSINPEIESDRGFIRFYSADHELLDVKEETLESVVLNHTNLYGNGLPLELAKSLIDANNSDPFSVISDKSVITKPEGSSWFNDIKDSSACFFSYIDKNTSEECLAAVNMKGMSVDVTNVDQKLLQSIESEVVLSIPKGIFNS
ncbi:hypothetical protein C4G84_RS22935 [Vibrio parahaemolyticus O5:K30]|uniref:hypothetical protein n=1 Tax=Vibrio TaxID=662 RepID=UPI001E4E8C29|nr:MULTISPECIES: hypothetical protein [Vibrio]EJG0766637.1 hypothetical protein [Vibrio parahaemolyticus O5:K30]MBE4779213.1 hypothetical protein [Vibrio parahaemolyticus]MDG3414673.1 hypothetical protein [Vibrio parahaemolyticus]MDW1968135.1 hypothetical protein [Vibrio sp. Vb0587]